MECMLTGTSIQHDGYRGEQLLKIRDLFARAAITDRELMTQLDLSLGVSQISGAVECHVDLGRMSEFFILEILAAARTGDCPGCGAGPLFAGSGRNSENCSFGSKSGDEEPKAQV